MATPKFCTNEDCVLPPWRDGIDEAKCLGHQPAAVPAHMEHPTTGEVLEVEDPTTDELLCWDCGAKPPTGLALVDATMAGEVMCKPCIDRLGARIRYDDEGYNY